VLDGHSRTEGEDSVYIDIEGGPCTVRGSRRAHPGDPSGGDHRFCHRTMSLGFVIIAVSEQLIRSIMVGDDPEMLMSDLQNQFPNHAIELNEDDGVGLVAKVVELIDRPDKAALPSALSRDIKPDTIGPRGCKIEWLEAYRLMDAHRSAARRCNGGIRDPIGERCAGGQVDLNRAHSNPGAAAAGCAER
jgi:hypothetical protein